MAVSSVSFSAAVNDWVRQTEQRMTAVFRESSQRVIAEMQRPVGAGGRMPIDTGFLRSSLVVSVNGEAVTASRPNPGGTFSYVASLAIAGAEIGDRITASYGANYAPHVEYGVQGRAPAAFVRGAAAQWGAIVTKVATEAQSGKR